MAAPMNTCLLGSTKTVSFHLTKLNACKRALYCTDKRKKDSKGTAFKDIRKDKDGYRILEHIKVPPVRRVFNEEKKEFTEPLIKQNINLKGPRYTTMPVDQDWTNVWPSAHTFKQSAIPLPVRQGQIKSRLEAAGDGLSPSKYGNLELMKIPNFLHLTPNHIRKHCIAIKKFTTPWPKELDSEEAINKHFPFKIVTKDYCFAGPSIRDQRARVVKIKFPLKSLMMDDHGVDKFIKLVGDRYNPETGTVTMEEGRCPLKSQNLEYLMFQVTALFFESMKKESWEELMTEDDMRQTPWGSDLGRKSLELLLNKDPELKESESTVNVQDLVGKKSEELKQDLVSRTDAKPVTEKVYNYKIAAEQLLNGMKDKSDIDNYKEAVLKLLNLQKEGIQTELKQ